MYKTMLIRGRQETMFFEFETGELDSEAFWDADQGDMNFFPKKLH